MRRIKFYSKGYFEKRDVLPIHFSETLNLQLKNLPVKKILDVGCGTGKLVKFLNKKGYEAFGCDIADEAVKISGQVKGSATSLPFKTDSFDLVTAISLVEHLTPNETEKFFNEAQRVLKPKGYFFLITPNLWSLIKIFKKKNWFAYTDPTHIQFYTPMSLKKLLQKHYFSNFRFRFKVDPKTPADWCFARPYLSQPLQFLANYLLISTPIAYFREGFWVLCQK